MTYLISDEQIRDHFTMSMCIEAVEGAFAAAGRSGTHVTERKVAAIDGAARLLSLTAASPELGRLVANIYTGAPPGHDKRNSPINRRQKLYLLFDAATGACEAIVGGAHLAWLKTGAMGAVAIKHLSSPSSERLTILGSGRQARAALAGALEVRSFGDVTIWSRTIENAEKMAAEFSHHTTVSVSDSARAAVEGADVVVTATTATHPILEGEWLASGSHVNSIGAHYPDARELDTEVVRRSTVFVDTAVTARAEKGELLIAESEGMFSFDEVVGELGQVVAGAVEWARGADENTLFASCGSAIESLGASLGAFHAIPEDERRSFTF